mgnify:FL=1
MIGLVPDKSLRDAGLSDFPFAEGDYALQKGVEVLGLSEFAPFSIEERILEKQVDKVIGSL